MKRKIYTLWMLLYLGVLTLTAQEKNGKVNIWEGTDNSLLMFIIAIGWSIVITALSIGVGYILHKGKMIEKFVYGK